jgi:hypothetical protein
MTTTGYRVTIVHYPSGRWLESVDFKKRPNREKDIDPLPRLQVPGSYEITVCTVDSSQPPGLDEGRREYGYLKHVDGIWHTGQPDPWPRRCFWIPAEPYDENGWVPSIVVEGKPGHTPLAGNGACARPWYWGTTYNEAKQVCERENKRTFGLSPAEALAIVFSSMNAGTGKRGTRGD